MLFRSIPAVVNNFPTTGKGSLRPPMRRKGQNWMSDVAPSSICQHYAEPCSLGDNSVSRQRWRMPAMEGQSDCPNKSPVVDEIVARLKAKKEG